MNTIELMKRHLGQSVKVKFGDDELAMAPLKSEDIPELMEFYGELSKASDGDGEDFKVVLNKKMSNIAIPLIKKSLIYADKSVGEDVKTLDEFIASNFLKLMPQLSKINAFSGDREMIKQEKMEKIKKRINESPRDSKK